MSWPQQSYASQYPPAPATTSQTLTPTTDAFSGPASSGANYSQSMPSNSASNFLYGTNVSNGSLSGMNNSVVGYKMRESSGNEVNDFSMRVIMLATHNQLVMNPVYLELLTKCVRLEAEAKIQSELRQEIVKSLVTRPPITEQGLGPFNIPDAIPASSSMTPNWVIIKLEPLKKEDYPLASILWLLVFLISMTVESFGGGWRQEGLSEILERIQRNEITYRTKVLVAETGKELRASSKRVEPTPPQTAAAAREQAKPEEERTAEPVSLVRAQP
ncbi:hypothetical protein K435DRAFT_799146 [Dendrothele bispora CBS 962.96]|uniref:Uncharacterized protein n=1 Tax=Dendrothele bispora (strain CBS 962.96) TaxID=1314807 RepID=A0A4S8LWR6_DENBC|nr:hypothetical protein K435DRAFT_799146 [Dendrothele bispora CBS 962.96]